jgi:hypothetical protein
MEEAIQSNLEETIQYHFSFIILSYKTVMLSRNLFFISRKHFYAVYSLANCHTCLFRRNRYTPRQSRDLQGFALRSI